MLVASLSHSGGNPTFPRQAPPSFQFVGDRLAEADLLRGSELLWDQREAVFGRCFSQLLVPTAELERFIGAE